MTTRNGKLLKKSIVLVAALFSFAPLAASADGGSRVEHRRDGSYRDAGSYRERGFSYRDDDRLRGDRDRDDRFRGDRDDRFRRDRDGNHRDGHRDHDGRWDR